MLIIKLAVTHVNKLTVNGRIDLISDTYIVRFRFLSDIQRWKKYSVIVLK